MRRTFLACLAIFGATAAFAANPYFLDRNGVLWNATASSDGLLLSGQRDGVVLTQNLVPFPILFPGAADNQIQVVADDLTGKVAVLWQRQWNSNAAEIMLAVWNGRSWERVEHLSTNLGAIPRNPSIRLTTVATRVPDPNSPDDPNKATIVQDSFVHAAWWEGSDQTHGMYALLQLTADPGDPSGLTLQDLSDFTMLGFPCTVPVPAQTLEHPVFASDSSSDSARLLFGSQEQCLLLELDVHFSLEASAASAAGAQIVNRRRHTPIFGVAGAFPLNANMSMDDTRVILGTNQTPVAYRVLDGGTLQYVTFSKGQWSDVRTLPVSKTLTMDQAISLVENLAR